MLVESQGLPSDWTCVLKAKLDTLDIIRREPGPEVIKLEYSLKLKIKHNDWLLEDMCAASSQSLRFILSLRMNSSFITSGPGIIVISLPLIHYSN